MKLGTKCFYVRLDKSNSYSNKQSINEMKEALSINSDPFSAWTNREGKTINLFEQDKKYLINIINMQKRELKMKMKVTNGIIEGAYRNLQDKSIMKQFKEFQNQEFHDGNL